MTVTEALLWISACLTAICGVTTYVRYVGRKRKRAPGPSGFPFLGILLELGPLNSLHKGLTSIGKSYGRYFQFKLLGKRVVVLRSASIVQQAFDNEDFDDRKETFFQKYVFEGKGFAFANYGRYVPELRELFQ